MVVGINNNLLSRGVARQVDTATSSVQRSLTRLSSGLRINTASDDAAGLAVSANLSSRARIFGQAIRNVNDGISALNIAQGGIDALSQIVIRQRELASQSANGSLSSSQRAALDAEAQALRAQFNQTTANTKFNGIDLLSNSNRTLSIQQGIGSSNSVGYSFNSDLQRLIGSGTYNSTSVSGFSTGGFDTTSGDFNGDGFADVVYSDSNTLQTIVRYGNGDGTFQAAEILGGGGGSIQVADANNDGLLDVLVADFNTYTIKVFAQKNGSLIESAEISFSTSVAAAYGNDVFGVGDANGDGNLDIFVLGTGDTVHTLILNNNFGVDSEIVNESPGTLSGLSTITVGDFNGDGYADAVVSTENGVVILENDQTGTLSDIGTIGSSNSFSALELVDVNGDGILDLLIGGSVSEAAQGVRLGDGTGTFTAMSGGPSLLNYYDIHVVDINGDGYLDIVGGTASNVVQRLGQSDGSFGTATTFGQTASRITISDFNGDGINDILGAPTSTSWSLSIQDTTYTNNERYFSLTTVEGALSAMDYLSALQDSIGQSLGKLGASQARLATGTSALEQARLEYTAAASRITDVDVAFETAELTRNQIRQNVGTSLLAQANLTPSLALILLKTDQ